MAIYTRYKRPGGLRALVELLESSAPTSRKKMIDKGLIEDEKFTRLAESYILTWEDVINLSDPELCETLAKANPRAIGMALIGLPTDQVQRFLRNSPMKSIGDIREMLEQKLGPREVSGARVLIVQATRELEKAGVLKVKKIPEMVELTE